jgi:hypothetical protein
MRAERFCVNVWKDAGTYSRKWANPGRYLQKLVPFRLGLDRGLILRDLEEMDGASDSEEVVAEETGCGDAAIAQGGDGEESNEWIAAGRASGAAD